MPNKKLTGLFLLASIMSAAMPTMPAHAGFEWRTSDGIAPPPVEKPYTGGTYLPAPAIAATSAPEVISPVIITGDAPSPSPSPSRAPSEPSSIIPSLSPATASPTTASSLPSPAPASTKKLDLATATISVSRNTPADKVQGFGSAIPLALALRQIIPAEYSSSIDPDVDMNTLISYKGGKPWRDTLRDALAPLALVAREEGQTVAVGRGTAASASPAPAPVLMPIETTRTISQSPYAKSSRPMADAASASLMPEGWHAERGSTLRKTLNDWCRRSGVELQWQAEYDYPVEASAHFNSSFEDAVRNLLVGFDGARPQPIGELHTNTNAGQMVLVVQTRGNNYSN